MILPLAYLDNLNPVELVPVGSFIAPGFVNVNEVFTLTDTSTGNPTSWQWRLNGVLFSSQVNPSLSIGTSGLHVIELTVANSWGSNTVERIIECFEEPQWHWWGSGNWAP